MKKVIEARLRMAGVENEFMIKMLAKKVMIDLDKNRMAMPIPKTA